MSHRSLAKRSCTAPVWQQRAQRWVRSWRPETEAPPELSGRGETRLLLLRFCCFHFPNNLERLRTPSLDKSQVRIRTRNSKPHRQQRKDRSLPTRPWKALKFLDSRKQTKPAPEPEKQYRTAQELTDLLEPETFIMVLSTFLCSHISVCNNAARLISHPNKN